MQKYYDSLKEPYRFLLALTLISIPFLLSYINKYYLILLIPIIIFRFINIKQIKI